MIRQCAWCSRVFGQVAPLEDVSVTHGVCQECYAKFMEAHEDRSCSLPPAADDWSAAILSVDAIP